jgi:glycosyltransferase involved in cell wall biosynthesis
MAMGCITIGYTGVGGAEFFTPEVGVPVPDDDIVGFYRAVVDTVREYDADPSRLDAMRRRASDHILSTYTRQKSAKALLKAVAEIAR